MADIAHEQTDALIEKMEKRINSMYSATHKDMERKLKEYMRDYNAKNKQKQRDVKSGKITQEQYEAWLKTQGRRQKWLTEMTNTLAEDLTTTDVKAMSMVRGFLPEAYAINRNYAAFEVEKGSMLDTSFTLYDAHTVENLIKNRPNLLPEPSPDVPKDLRWNKQKITTQVTKGILEGESIPEISKRLQDVTDMDKRAAIRNARTAATGAQNAGRVDGYKYAQSLGIDLKQEWLATLDGRTRQSHRALDGERIEVGKVFSNGCRYPGDPSGPAAEVYNCRCTLVAAIEGIDQSNAPRNSRLGDMSYEEWKGQHSENREVPNVRPEVAKTWKDKVNEIKEMTTKSNHPYTEEDIRKAGSFLAEEYNAHVQELAKIRESVQKQIDELNSKIYELKEQSGKLADELDSLRTSCFVENKISIEEYQKKSELLWKEQDSIYEKERALLKARRDLDSVGKENYTEQAKWLSEKIAEVRPIGGRVSDMNAHFMNSKSSVRPDIEKAYSLYPADWVSRSVDYGKMKPKAVQRGYYSHSKIAEIAISGTGLETSIHELGHRFEQVVPGIKELEKEFYDRRTKGENLVWLGKGYSRDEVTRPDDFLSKYMGKDYEGYAYELVSMGFQYAYTEPDKLARDRDMQEWIYGLLLLR